MADSPLPRSPRRLSRTQREAQLIAVAQSLFAQKGYQGTAMEDIASGAGVTRPILYKHFGSKDGIYLASLAQAREQLESQMLQAVAAQNSPQQRLAAGLRAYFEFVQAQGDAWEILFGGGAAVAGTAEAEARELRFRTVERIALLLQFDLGNTLPPERIRAFAHLISGGAEQLAKWWRQNPGLRVDDLVQAQMALSWGGLAELVRSPPVHTDRD
ncbi:MAG: TetR/AcrR family transcriptional regulator [Oceanococcaceae bacterium]